MKDGFSDFYLRALFWQMHTAKNIFHEFERVHCQRYRPGSRIKHGKTHSERAVCQ